MTMPPLTGWKTGVYKWVNTTNGKVYVGGAYASFTLRKHSHLGALRRGTHRNKHLQAAWNKYGEIAFKWVVLQRCAPHLVEKWEQYWLDTLTPWKREIGYNICQYAEVTLGYKHTKEAKAVMSKAAIERFKDPTKKAAFIERCIRAKQIPEHRKKQSEASIKKWQKPGYREHMSEVHKGRIRPKEERDRIKASMIRVWIIRKARLAATTSVEPIV